MHYIFRTFILCALCFCFSSKTIAQWNHFVTNFKKDLYGGGAQTWQIKSYGNDYSYFANINGLLEFNGNDWELHPFNNKTHVRSIHMSHRQNRIYAGGESEFGYFEPDQNGRLIYTNLSENFIRSRGLSGGFWGVFEADNILYFVSDRYIIKLIDDEFTLISSEQKIDCSALVDNVLLLGTYDGIKMLVGNTLISMPHSDVLKNKVIRSIMPYQDGFLVATALNGLYLGKDNRIEPLVTGHERFMQENEIFSLAVSEKYLAVGTIHKGLLLLDSKDFSPQYYNEENGLQNNTVLSLSFDNRQNIWLGLDNGIDYISTDSHLSNLYSYPNSKGSGYSSLVKGGRLYLGTNRGLFYTEWPVNFTERGANLRFFPELSGQVWQLAAYDDGIFCMHDKGLFFIKNNQITQIPNIRGAISFIPHETDAKKCWVTTYDSFFLLQKENNKWEVARQFIEIANWPKNVVFESAEVLWVRKLDEGMERILLDTVNYRIKESRIYSKKEGLTSSSNLYTYKINGEIYFSSDSGYFSHDSKTDKIIKSKFLDEIFTKGATVINQYDNRVFALSPNNLQISNLNDSPVLSQPQTFPFAKSKVDFIRFYEAMNMVNDSLVIIPNEHGFALLNTSHNVEVENSDLFIKNAYITYPKDSLIFQSNFLNNNIFPEISYNHNAIRIEYGVRSFGLDKAVQFRYKLSPDPIWSALTTATVKEYNNLKEGDYTFEIEAFYPNGEVNKGQFSFTILPPWYRSTYAWVGYICLLLLAGRFLYLLEERRLTKRKKKELAEKEQEIIRMEKEFLKENMLKEQEIVELKNENLEQELKHKSQEMANLMINLSRKNEALIAIKKELTKVLGEMNGESTIKPKRLIVSLNNKIDLNIQSDDMFKRFEEQFDLVHNKFISKLRSKHPDLTVGELKMCAYLKMNLTSKEIAPLLNLSVRGVETLRYRLRKKIDMEREENLIEYLNSI